MFGALACCSCLFAEGYLCIVCCRGRGRVRHFEACVGVMMACTEEYSYQMDMDSMAWNIESIAGSGQFRGERLFL